MSMIGNCYYGLSLPPGNNGNLFVGNLSSSTNSLNTDYRRLVTHLSICDTDYENSDIQFSVFLMKSGSNMRHYLYDTMKSAGLPNHGYLGAARAAFHVIVDHRNPIILEAGMSFRYSTNTGWASGRLKYNQVTWNRSTTLENIAP